MKIELEEKNHTYFVDGEIASISITELLRKHGLAPDYGSVSKAKLSQDVDLIELNKERKAYNLLKLIILLHKYSINTNI